jgi:hypothetical protein
LSLFISYNFAIDVLVAKKPIFFEQKLEHKHLRLVKVPTLKKSCVPLTLRDIENNNYLTSHYINKNSILCLKDIKKDDKKSVVFNFGSLEIEKKGKIVFENEQFIRIKKDNGKIEKIYKDGRLK